jgi:MFS family permease
MSDRFSLRRRPESLAVFATVLRSSALLRTQAAYFLFAVVELATWIAMLVYSYDEGGATAAGVVAFAQLAPAILFAPIAATVGDRASRTRVLAVAYLVFALASLGVGALLVTGQPPLVVYAGAVICGLTLTLVRPAHTSVMPDIARTPSELTAANVATGTSENLGVVVGSLGGGILLGIIGPGGVYLAGAVALLAGALLVVRLHVAGAGRAWAAHLGQPVAWQAAGDRAHGHAHPRALAPEEAEIEAAMAGMPSDSRGSLAAELAGGIRTGLGNRLLRPLVIVVGLSFLLQGTADVLQVVLALDVADMGESGVGLLSSAIGLGGLLGAGMAIGLVGRRRLLGVLLVAALVAGAGLAMPGVLPLPIVGMVGFFVLGSGRTLIDVIGRTLLQRVTPERFLTRVFGVVEGAALAGLALGTLVAPALVEIAGPTASLVLAGLILPGGVAILRGQLARSEAAGVVHERELAALRAVGMFSSLPLPVLERLAAHADHLAVASGEVVIAEGDTGDAYYMIEKGTCVVTRAGRELNRMGPGEGFGEIALLDDVPRTATITATSDMELFELDREPFLEALTGQSAAFAIARRVADERLTRGS